MESGKQLVLSPNREIAKAILGQTLSSDIGQHGNRAAAEVHYQVKEDIIRADQRLVAEAFNKLFTLVTLFNHGVKVPAPRLVFTQMEELHKDRAERDKILYDMGARFNVDYLLAHYGIDKSHDAKVVFLPGHGQTSMTPRWYSSPDTAKLP